ncbi:MAG: TauD/TfdA family dioxygenase [Rhodospirillales bacterium]
MPVSLSPLTETIGIEATGVDLSGPVDDADLAAMQDALHEHLVMVVRDQNLTPAQYLDAMSLFGDLMDQHLTELLMPEHPKIAVLDSRRAKRVLDGEIVPIGAKDWHTDHTNHARPPKMTAIYAVQLPSTGGDTGFANMQAAFAGLPDGERTKLEPLVTVNVIEQDTEYVSDSTRDALTREPQRHPFIRTHPETGKKAIYVHPGKLAHIDGMAPEESHSFVNDLLARTITPDVTYRHKWRPGDLVIWDNRGTLHLAYRDYDVTEGRIMHRVILEGEVPV